MKNRLNFLSGTATGTFILVTLFLILLSIQGFSQVDANINGSFEQSTVTTGADTSAVEGWVFNLGANAAASFRIVDDVVKDGGRALAVHVDTVNGDPWSIEVLSDPVTVVPGELYRYSIWVKSDSVGATAHFTVGNPSFDEHFRTERTANIDTSWILVSDTFTVAGDEPEQARGPIHLNFPENAGKTVYLDSLRITQMTGVRDSSFLPVIVEAEDGVLDSELGSFTEVDGTVTYITATTSSGGTFPGANRTALYQVTFPSTGTYDLYVRLKVGDGGSGDDSFYYGNGFGEKNPDAAAEWILCNGLNIAGFDSSIDVVSGPGNAGIAVWKWLNLSRNSYYEQPVSFTIDTPEELTKTFALGAREDGLEIDKIAFGRSDLFFTVGILDSVSFGLSENPIKPILPIATDKPKFLGNVSSSAQRPRFLEFWNQVTPENEGKWGSVEGSRDNMNWGGLDAAYNFAKDNNMPFRYHVLIWGNQQPEWIETLPPAEQLAEIEEWFAAVAERYPDIDYLEVVNEPLHDPPNRDDNGGGNYINALGGRNDLYGTGRDWIIKSFELARQYFPDSTKLLINDYSIVNDNSATTNYINIINLLIDRGLIDGIAVQGHAFSTTGSMTTVRNNLNRLEATGLPIQVSEMDIDGSTDEVQLANYQRIFPTFWEHPGVIGITLWGWRIGMWRTDQGAYLIDSDGNERPALVWLRNYVKNTIVGIRESVDVSLIPQNIELYANYPNPFNPTTQISYDLPKASEVQIDVFDITGRHIQTLVKGSKNAGSHTVSFNAAKLASGIYIYRLKAGDFSANKRMILLK